MSMRTFEIKEDSIMKVVEVLKQLPISQKAVFDQAIKVLEESLKLPKAPEENTPEEEVKKRTMESV